MEVSDSSGDSRMGKAIVRGVLIGLPLTFIGLTLGIFLITDNDFFDSMATAILPSILLGTFGGGFAGMALTME
ncbi:MAG: hypothetical protein WEB67_03875 [Acidimicrobiia bacterium]